MKNQKLKLNKLKVQSFTTSLEKEGLNDINGGIKLPTGGFCQNSSEGIFICEIAPFTQTLNHVCPPTEGRECRRG